MLNRGDPVTHDDAAAGAAKGRLCQLQCGSNLEYGRAYGAKPGP